MIKDIRIDDRLIHGQIALTWPKALEVSRIVVVNDKAASDTTQQMALKMAVPSGIKVLIRSVEGAIEFFKNPKVKKVDLMVIVGNVQDAAKLYTNIDNEMVKRVNLANVGRFDGVDDSEKIQLIDSNIKLNEQEQRALTELVSNPNLKIVHQIIPDNKEQSIRSFL
ncbi:PTS system mannose/fructose/N-acetylgalactosamine-transporter subunit IIB [Aerococcus loyolae]|uniref:PTS sugar transporter subunit IIB n=1 Tax=Aerococcus loyolae TaxID=2976809 RepID=A0ABT4C047_9LACT|nr:PTS sugar transporter subunit IIB [Aerococcus loyolae]MCY3024906.1 PTS sugar transporter subunit IIB [Aerococcus loyolae]MCY3027039.1 PTS sugar transporter subunit IIB [Aerococcus loyolae]MCY3028622.1 PTS sugar transporter subunit IIB [Aerococcus loyolae]OAM70574.1 hypothetical protein A1D21_02920 [Aerococcus loyolae]